jgi:adenylate cyclase
MERIARHPDRRAVRLAVAILAAALPLVGLVSLLLRSELDPHFENYRAHFVVFGIVGGSAFVLGYAAGEAANRRGDARVLLLSLPFMATGGFLGLHALGTAGVLFTKEYAASWSRSRSAFWSVLSSRVRQRSSTSGLTSPRF